MKYKIELTEQEIKIMLTLIRDHVNYELSFGSNFDDYTNEAMRLSDKLVKIMKED